MGVINFYAFVVVHLHAVCDWNVSYCDQQSTDFLGCAYDNGYEYNNDNEDYDFNNNIDDRNESKSFTITITIIIIIMTITLI